MQRRASSFDPYGLDSDHDVDGDDGSRRDRDDDGGGSPFNSQREADFMPMTRRDEPEVDVDYLTRSTLRDTRAFIQQREQKPCERSFGEQLRDFGEIGLGVAGGAYLSQRYRQNGGIVPLGVLLGGMGLGASYLQLFGRYNADVRNVSIGTMLASLAILMAGRGAVGAEHAQTFHAPTTAGGAPPPPDQQAWPGAAPPQGSQVFAPPFAAPPFVSSAPAYAPWAPPQLVPPSPFAAPFAGPTAPPGAVAAPASEDDLRNLVTRWAA